MGAAIRNGWTVLPCGAEVLLDAGIPRRLWASEQTAGDEARLAAETADVCGFHVLLDAWEPGTMPGEVEAGVRVVAAELDHVLQCLAMESARVFFDRYHKVIEAEDTDWDDEAYAQDMNTALGFCGMKWEDVDPRGHREVYCQAMHGRTEELVRETRTA